MPSLERLVSSVIFAKGQSDRPIVDRESWNATKITTITGRDRCSKFFGDGCDPQIVVPDIQFGADEQVELRPSGHGHGGDRERNDNSSEQHRGMFVVLRSLRRARQAGPAAR